MAELTSVGAPVPAPVSAPVSTPASISTNALLSQVNNPQAVYSAPNIAQSVTNPVVRPNLSDPFRLYESYMNSAEIQAARNEVNKSNQELLGVRQTARTQNQAIENLPQALNVIRGEQAVAGSQAALREQAAAENLIAGQSLLDSLTSRASERYNIAVGEREKLQQLIASAPGAKISYKDSYESAVKKADKYIKEQAKEEAKQAYKQELKSQLLALGKNTRGLSVKELEKKLKKYNKEALASAKAREDEEWRMKVAQFNKSMSGGGTAGERLGTAGASAQSALLASRGTDGKVDPGVYTTQRAAYMIAGGTAADFDSQFGGLLSTGEQSYLGISTASSKASAEQNQTAEKAKQTALSALDIVQRLKNAGSAIGNAVGPISSKLPTLRGSSADFEQNYNSLKALLTLENMGVMKGVLSDSDIKIIQNASANLSLGQSESGFRAELDRIQTILQNRMGGANNDPLGLGF